MAMVQLANLEKTRISSDLQGKFAFLYGPEKIGKTTIAGEFPDPLFLSFEPGTNGLDNFSGVIIESWFEARKYLPQLSLPTVREKFKTIVIDTADEAWKMCEDFIKTQNPTKQGDIPKTLSDAPFAYGSGWAACDTEFSKFINGIARLGYGLVIISHSKKTVPEQIEGQPLPIPIFSSVLPAKAKGTIFKLVDIIGLICTDGEKNGGLPNGQRYIYLRSDGTFEGGNRFQYLPEKVELSYEKFSNAVVKAIEEEAKVKSGEAPVKERIVVQGERALLYSFDEAMSTAKTLYLQLIETGKETEVEQIITEVFGKNVQLSKTLESQQSLLEEVIRQFKELV